LRDLIHQFKYRDHPRFGYGFAWLIAQYAPSEIWRNTDVLVPVPMYRKKQRRRGYNQAQVLTQALSRQTGIPSENNLLLRVKNTKPQSALGPADREQNVKDAFALGKKKKTSAKSFLLIDDIYTTGETLSACAKVLLDNGAARVRGLTLAIAAGQSENK
jgi:ComF family protein